MEERADLAERQAQQKAVCNGNLYGGGPKMRSFGAFNFGRWGLKELGREAGVSKGRVKVEPAGPRGAEERLRQLPFPKNGTLGRTSCGLWACVGVLYLKLQEAHLQAKIRAANLMERRGGGPLIRVIRVGPETLRSRSPVLLESPLLRWT